jgi:hypothetical protein
MNDLKGIAPRERVFRKRGALPGQVFAAEILTQPVVLRHAGGVVEVHVDRRGVTDAVYTTEGKNRLCDAALRDEREELAARLDADIHAFMMEADDGSWLEIPTNKIPLRWASGGVLPVVKWRGHVWSPFFFRDIAPVGWNIAAGSSETEAELRRPVAFGLREFVEETIVLSRAPEVGAEVTARTFPSIIEERRQIHAALKTVNRHLNVRSQEDGFAVSPFPARADDIPPDRAIAADFAHTRTRLHIRDDKGEEVVPDVLVCFNLLELGIEVISVLRYELADNDYLLDGEMLTPVGGKTELIRMPVAMISHQYLREVFGTGRAELAYEHPPLIEYSTAHDVWRQVRAGQPSVLPARPPRPDEVVVFGWDVDRRADLSGAGSRDDAWKSDPMRVRHRQWGKTFARFFETGQRVGPPREAYPYFTAGSAKSVAYFFSQMEESELT